MTGLSTVLTVLAAWALLGVLFVGLLLVFKSLQSIRHWFEKITVGVRAVEHQTRDLPGRGNRLKVSLAEALEELDRASERLSDVRRSRS
jgi:uncharacterized protein YoxC